MKHKSFLSLLLTLVLMASMTNLTSTWAQENTNDKIITGDMLEKSFF